MKTEEKAIIDKAIEMNGIFGVVTLVLADGTVWTNHIDFRDYFSNNLWTQEMRDYVLTRGKK